MAPLSRVRSNRMDDFTGHPGRTAPVRLRPYQQDAVREIRSRVAAGVRHLIVVAPTGSGKTTIAAHIIAKAAERGSRVLFMAHRRELISQAYNRLIQLGVPEKQLGILMGRDRRYRPGSPVQVASVDTLRNRAKPLADIVFVDECHRSTAKTYRDIAAYYPDAIHLGPTATPFRANGEGLDDAYNDLLLVASPRQLIDEGHLVEPRVFTVPTESLPDLSAVRMKRGDYDQRALAEAVDSKMLVGNLVEHWMRHTEGVRTVAFAVSTDDREAGARSTVERKLVDQPATGYGQLAAKWPEVAMAVDQVTASGAEAYMRALATSPTTEVPLSIEETTASLEETIRAAPPGVLLISAECGLGKTEAAIRVAAERAAKKHSSPKATGKRAPLQSKTSISVDKNALAEQVQDRLDRLGVPAKRVFGPLSVLRDDGTPECRFHEVAQALVAGGQSMQRELCEGRGRFKCEHYRNCTARLGYEGPNDARVTIGPHALISALDKAAGTTGLLVVDEPPYLLEMTPITLDDVVQTETTFSAFDRDYADTMRPALQAVRAWIESSTEASRSMAVKDAVRAFSGAVEPGLLDIAQMAAEVDGDAVECAANAPFLDSRSKAPPLRQVEVARARSSVARAKQLGKASGVLGAIYHALTAPWQVVGSIEEVVGQPVLVITAARRDLTEALRRDGAVVVMDANIGIHAGIYEKALG